MKEQILLLLIEHFGEVSSVALTLVVAWIKKKWDLKTLENKGFLKKDRKEKKEI